MEGEAVAAGFTWDVIAGQFWMYLIADVILSGLALLAWLALFYVVLKRLNVCPATDQLIP